ncbi:hypothetical protein K2Z84_21425 [Candidatus Binatia bacterium]|nr:hypothetical protein [Candidatus Binatia bacterium]
MSTPTEYARRRARETGKLYAVWSVDGADQQWAASWSRVNQREYRARGATRVDIYDKGGWRTGRDARD